jgi:hypothetical protein
MPEARVRHHADHFSLVKDAGDVGPIGGPRRDATVEALLLGSLSEGSAETPHLGS